jgi:protein-S-isoprenylcysteine O-methyltransferase Ste14
MSTARDTAGVIAPPPLIGAIAVVLGLVLDRLLPAYVLTVLLPFSVRIVLGTLVMAAGFALALPAVFAFRRANTHVEPWKPTSALVSEGVYRYLRNPMYIGATLMLAGFAVLFASDWTLVMTVAFALIVHFGVVKREERYLDAKFGDAYRTYKRCVPRYGWPPAGAA